MSILIKGMKMPKSCDSCDLIQFDDEELEAHCPLSPYYRWRGTPPDYKPEGCPLVEVPTPHGRLIDADEYGANYIINYDKSPLKVLEITPTIIEAEVSEGWITTRRTVMITRLANALKSAIERS